MTQDSPRTPSSSGASETARTQRTEVRWSTHTRDDVTIECGSVGEGYPVVLLPSLGRGAQDFAEVAQHLAADGFRVLMPQPRGIGRSVGPMEQVTMSDLAADVALVMDALLDEPAVVVGHAFGSQPARMLAVERTDLVRGLVLAAASAGKMPPGAAEAPFSRLRAEIDGSGDPSLPEEERVRCLQAAFFAPGHDPRVWLDGWSWPTHEIQAHARRTTDVDAYFEAGGVPVLDLQAEHDAVVIPGVLRPLLGERVSVQVVRDAGHALLPEQPRAVSEAVASYARALLTADRP
ncbi:alpha/beta fold hydrolase [Janibacter melonis]|uniref:alpha/beta fold hydrolase n=1 Tax=Janibacter melonis TaxID=262209 RepID=UPI000A02B0BD|nr:alpha/beta hydrolase [Janibacter melonis]